MQEGWGRNLMAAGLMDLGAMGAGCNGPNCKMPQQAATQSQMAVDADDFTTISPEKWKQGHHWHPYSYQDGKEVPNWELAQENMKHHGKTYLKPQHQYWFDQHFK